MSTGRALLGELSILDPEDEPGRLRAWEVHQCSLRQLDELLCSELRRELSNLLLPLEGPAPGLSELRIAQAQLVGWLDGLLAASRGVVDHAS